MTNCINCGAVIEQGANKCPYCNTSYFDFTGIDIDAEKPVMLKLKYNGYIVETLVLPRLCEVEYNTNCVDFRDNINEAVIFRKTISNSIDIDLKFSSIWRSNQPLMTITKEEET